MLDKLYGFVTVSASAWQSTFLPLIQYLALCLCVLGKEMRLIFVHFAASDAVISAEPYKICFTLQYLKVNSVTVHLYEFRTFTTSFIFRQR